MMKCETSSFIFLLCGMLCLTSCSTNMFDPEVYEKVIVESFPIDNIDEHHTWNLTKSYKTVVTPNPATSDGIKIVRILSGNPYKETNVEILAEDTVVKQGEPVMLFYHAPEYRTSFYANIVTAKGQDILKAFTSDESSIDFAQGAEVGQGKINPMTYQTYTYLYEDDYPKPGDWDFNDLVLRIQKLPGLQKNSIRLRVTLAAVGTKKQMAAAIRLIGYNYDDIESVTIEEGRTFDGSFDQRRVFIEDADLLLRGRNNEAVINLFEDAHYALSPRLNSQDRGGGTVRMFYNTSRNPDGTNSLQIAPKSLTYVIKFRNPRILQNFTLETLDPFAMEDFNSGKWEVHLGPYKEAQVMYDLGDNETASINRMVWALKIPSGDFKYPIEKQSLGLYKNGVLTGAYMMMDHSYGQWIADHTSSIDWFLYPTVGLVY